MDSFFAFGLFELARQSGYFQPELVSTFEPVIQEECRHILLFANWLAWHRANLSWWRRVAFECRVAAAWLFIARERLGLVLSLDDGKNTGRPNSNFTANSATTLSSAEINATQLLAICLVENDRRFAGYDRRLVRPTAMPKLARAALRFSKLWLRQKRPSPRV
jgi:hypothetical protein